MKVISVVIPCYNEEVTIPVVYQRVINALGSLSCDYEIIFVDNASTDNSVAVFSSLADTDERVHVLLMSRNFGTCQPSYFAGLKYARGDAVVFLDGDLQDPPEMIADFVREWQAGSQVVYGVRIKRRGSLLRRICYKIFYRVFRMLSYIDMPLDAGDFSLMDRAVVDVITRLPEKDVYVRGLRAWAGFTQKGIPYTRDDRMHGVTSIPFFANFSWAKKAIVNFSYKPLELISRITITTMFLTMAAGVAYLYAYFSTTMPRGFITILMFMFIFSTIQLFALSVIAEYMVRIFQEVKGRPPFVVRTILGKHSRSLDTLL